MKSIIITILGLTTLFLVSSGIKIQLSPFKINLPNWDVGIFAVLALVSVLYIHYNAIYNARTKAIIEKMPEIQLMHVNEQISIVNQWNEQSKTRIERLKAALNGKELDEFDRGYLRAVTSYERDLNEVYTLAMDELNKTKKRLTK